LSLRSVNSSRSAYACIFFSSMFFQHYSCRNTPELDQYKNHIQFRCKLVIKVSLASETICVVKTHNLAFQECEPLQAVFAKHLCPNVLKAQSRPVVFSLEDTLVEASFVLATLADAENRHSCESLHLFQGQRRNRKEYNAYPVLCNFRSSALERRNQGTVSNRSLQDLETAKNPADNVTITAEVQPPNPGYNKVKRKAKEEPELFVNENASYLKMGHISLGIKLFHSLFFGAISSSEEDVTNAFHSLATASDTEDFGNGPLSPAS
ncbi:hypothetical protein JD844_015201, partial [Phrynosoma platyrhinos]